MTRVGKAKDALDKARDAITGKARKADRAQAHRIASARADLETARDAHPLAVHRAGQAHLSLPPEVTRAKAVRERAEQIATPRARRHAEIAYVYGTTRPTGAQLRAAREIKARQPELGAIALRAELARQPETSRPPRRRAQRSAR